MYGPDRGVPSEPFVADLLRLADATSDPRLAALAARIAAPVRVAVGGRPGVGRRTVAAALQRAGVAVADADAGVAVHVVAEVCKPEDVAAVAAATRPTLVVLNKADLPGGADADEIARRLGTPVQPMSGLVGSGVGRVVERLTDLGAGLRYRRLTETMTRLAALAVENPRLAELLHGDAAVTACAAAAAAVVDAPGPAGDLARARHWDRHRVAPLSVLHRSCAADLARGSLRRWARTRESA
ncbi:hypothetical protein KIH27_06645 [Mycobacterium sp. M1]|uniref:Uncharacterized protein n=1 Tax=Mycolicibacter acidiphilus TaxID=2835306 RepID=A0ABS5RG61_9MYCO|nr:hypothetical protein [Mycolicibacter acidiphilus]MBS9533268.1 hypothetical protein [Mycolicibacter acidiphilus]